jgi:TolA-binding protein
MISWLSWFFDDLFYWIAVIALIGGAVAYVLSYLVSFLPMLKPHAIIMKVVGLALVILGGYYVSDHQGYQRRVAEDQAEIERLNSENRAKEAELQQRLAKTTFQLKKAKDDISQKQSDINKRVDSGELRLPTSCSVQASADARATSGDSANGGDIERQTIKALADIASDGDKAIVQLNACIDFYNQVKDKVNVKP